MVNQEMNEDNSNDVPGSGLLGDWLKQKRVEKNFTLEKMSQKTKISINILKSLETNDYGKVPSAAYIKGFVTSYVKVLGIPTDEAIGKMEQTYQVVMGRPFPALNHTKNMKPMIQGTGIVTPQEEEPSPHEVIEKGDSIIQNTKSLVPVAVFVGVVLLFVGGYNLISSIVSNEVEDKKDKDLGPKIESSSALVNQPAKKEVKPEENKDASATPSTTAATTPVVEEKKPETLVEIPRNFPTVNFVKIRSSLFSVKTDAPENSDTAILPDSVKNAMNPDLQNVYITATSGNTWTSYKIDEKPIESVIINKGTDLFLQGSEIRIFLGNVNVTKIFYNNYLIDAPTKNGVKSLVFPAEASSKYLLPLFPKAKDDILYTAEDYIKRMKLEEEELEKNKSDD